MIEGKIIQGLDFEDLVAFVEKKNKKYQAILLQNLEEMRDMNIDNFLRDNPDLPKIVKDGYIKAKQDEYKLHRKLILDWSNNYTRSILRVIFGDNYEGVLR